MISELMQKLGWIVAAQNKGNVRFEKDGRGLIFLAGNADAATRIDLKNFTVPEVGRMYKPVRRPTQKVHQAIAVTELKAVLQAIADGKAVALPVEEGETKVTVAAAAVAADLESLIK